MVFVAHLDEVGFAVTASTTTERSSSASVGGSYPSLWQGQPALVHTAHGPCRASSCRATRPAAARRAAQLMRADIGAGSRAAAESLGVRVGQTVTMPKRYVRLLGARATGRSFDDRVGSAALVLAARHLDRTRLRHTVVFLWSVREEMGLEGARAAARRARRAHRRGCTRSTRSSRPTRRSSAAQFALAPLGRGPVARAVDNGSVTPPAYVDSLAAVARASGIPLQIGTTNGGNDGSVVRAVGVPDVPVGWPLRYSHSPAEMVDLRDVARLAELVRVVAERW